MPRIAGRRRNRNEDPTTGTVVDPMKDPDKITRMPDPEDPIAREQLMRRALQKYRTSGRGNTIMTQILRNRLGS